MLTVTSVACRCVSLMCDDQTWPFRFSRGSREEWRAERGRGRGEKRAPSREGHRLEHRLGTLDHEVRDGAPLVLGTQRACLLAELFF